jgi:hypothetical protein
MRCQHGFTSLWVYYTTIVFITILSAFGLKHSIFWHSAYAMPMSIDLVHVKPKQCNSQLKHYIFFPSADAKPMPNDIVHVKSWPGSACLLCACDLCEDNSFPSKKEGRQTNRRIVEVHLLLSFQKI